MTSILVLYPLYVFLINIFWQLYFCLLTVMCIFFLYERNHGSDILYKPHRISRLERLSKSMHDKGVFFRKKIVGVG